MLKYTTPCAPYNPLYVTIAAGGHTLIAGSTGSGKSVLLNGFIKSLIATMPPTSDNGCKLVLIDPKKVELIQYADLPHTISYTTEVYETVQALDGVIDEMMRRYASMQSRREKSYQGHTVYVIIDELADLMTTAKGEIMPRLQRIAQLGRAAKIRLLCCTQSPSRKVIPAELTLNLSNKIALHCDSPIESRQVIGVGGAESLPRYGKAIWRSPDGLKSFGIPMVNEDEISDIVDFWKKQKT